MTRVLCCEALCEPHCASARREEKGCDPRSCPPPGVGPDFCHSQQRGAERTIMVGDGRISHSRCKRACAFDPRCGPHHGAQVLPAARSFHATGDRRPRAHVPLSRAARDRRSLRAPEPTRRPPRPRAPVTRGACLSRRVGDMSCHEHVYAPLRNMFSGLQLVPPTSRQPGAIHVCHRTAPSTTRNGYRFQPHHPSHGPSRSDDPREEMWRFLTNRCARASANPQGSIRICKWCRSRPPSLRRRVCLSDAR